MRAGLQGALCAALIVALIGACKRDETTGIEETPPGTTTTTVEEVDENPLRFYGERVTLNGEVDEVFSDRAFELEGMGVWWDDQILVVTRAPVVIGGAGLENDDEILVSGTVRPLTIVEIEREIGWDLDPQIEARFTNKPVLIADSISSYEEQARWSEREYPQGTIMGLYQIFTVPDISQLAGQRITVSAVPVLDKAGQVAWIGYGPLSRMLVVPKEAGTLDPLEAGERVTVTGTLEKMPSAAQARQQWNIPQEMLGEVVEGRPYIQAEQIQEIPR